VDPPQPLRLPAEVKPMPPPPPRGGPGEPGGTRGQPERTLEPAREWEIVIECSAAGVTVLPGQAPIALRALTRGENELSRLVRELIAQKRARQPQAQPRLRFRIHPDGLRAYYLAAAALEHLRLPVTWELLGDGAGPPPAHP
jgi:hypothetical protein